MNDSIHRRGLNLCPFGPAIGLALGIDGGRPGRIVDVGAAMIGIS